MTDTITCAAPAAAFGPGVRSARAYGGGVLAPATVLLGAQRPAVAANPAAPWTGTGLPVHGSTLRLRGLAAAGSTGSATTRVASVEAPVQLMSTTPGELPPRDPPS